MTNPGEISALISLVDDPDEQIYLQIKEKLVSHGTAAIPALENMWEDNSFGLLFQTRIEDIIHLIQFEDVKVKLRHWADHGADDLLAGVLLINRYQYPDLDEVEIRRQLSKLRQDVWLELNEGLTAFEKVKILNHILFEVHGYCGNKSNYHAPQNSYLSVVLESKKGNPLSLAIIYILTCQALEIPVFGVNLPKHFILSYRDDYSALPIPEEMEDVLNFYINPFSKGSILYKQEIDEFLHELKTEAKDEYYQPCSYLDIIKRMLHNLVYSYTKSGYREKVDEVAELLAVLTGPSPAEGSSDQGQL